MVKPIICDNGLVEQVVPLCKRFHTGIEIQAFFDPLFIDHEPDAISRHRQAIAGIDLISLHGCFGDLCPGSFDPLVREVARQRFEQSYRDALQLDAKHIIFHHGYVPLTSNPANWVKRSTAFWHSFLEGKDNAIRFYIENLFDREYRILMDTVDAIDRPNVKINLDIGHVNFASKYPIFEWIEQLGPRIGYVHMHDNHGLADEHLGFGMGTIPFQEVCEALLKHAPDAYWAVEAKENYLESSYQWLLEHHFCS